MDAHVSGDAITHARYAAQRVKDAVVDVMRARTGARPDVDVEAPDLRLNLVVRKGRAIVSVDLGGGPLHRRGWRLMQGEAPLKENLAAAVLLRGNWPAVYAEGGALLDPMCGSGTLVIEAALMAADVAPGLQRSGLGRTLTDAAIDLARQRRIPALFLLTTTADGYFPRFGFERIDRSVVPETVKESVEFKSACPASAIVMRKLL